MMTEKDTSLSMSEVTGIIQNLNDEVWDSFSEENLENCKDDSEEENQIAHIVFNSLVDSAVAHSIFHVSPEYNGRVPKVFQTTDFLGICMDNGAENTVAGKDQFLAYCNHIGTDPTLRPTTRKLKFGNVTHRSLGQATIRFPIDDKTFFEYESEVVDVDIPVIFGLDSMKKHGWEGGEVRNVMQHVDSRKTIRLVHKLGHLWREWNCSDILFTKVDLMKLHRRFGHPSSGKLYNLL